jgi:unsaturated rhamnogalacturonyl hydrolase
MRMKRLLTLIICGLRPRLSNGASGLRLIRSFALGLLIVPATAGHAEDKAASSPTALVRAVADAVLRDNPKPPDFNWGEGVMLSGMVEAYRLTKDDRYLAFVRQFAEHWEKKGIGALLSARGYCGHWGPGFALLVSQEIKPDPNALALSDEIIDFIMKRATRTADGGLDHFTGKPELWVDTLDMCCPLLTTKARLSAKPELQAEARRQLEIFARHLQHPATGLFYHHWSETTGKRTTNFWARGNGWVAMSLLETLRNEPLDSAAAQPLRQMLEKQASSLLRLQDPATGLWHTVLDAPDTYLETSASAMFLYALNEGGRLRLLSPSPEKLSAAWRGLAGQVNASGLVVGVSGGTGPTSKPIYAKVPTGTYAWGTGAFLLAACSWSASSASAKP